MLITTARASSTHKRGYASRADALLSTPAANSAGGGDTVGGGARSRTQPIISISFELRNTLKKIKARRGMLGRILALDFGFQTG